MCITLKTTTTITYFGCNWIHKKICKIKLKLKMKPRWAGHATSSTLTARGCGWISGATTQRRVGSTPPGGGGGWRAGRHWAVTNTRLLQTSGGQVWPCSRRLASRKWVSAGWDVWKTYIYMYSFSRRFYPKRLPRESFTKSALVNDHKQRDSPHKKHWPGFPDSLRSS